MINRLRRTARPYCALSAPQAPPIATSAVNNQDRTSYLFQGDYIRYPALHELSSKYGVAGSDQVPLPARLDELREHIRREIRKVCRVSLILRQPLSFVEALFFFCLCVHTVARSALCASFVISPRCPVPLFPPPPQQ